MNVEFVDAVPPGVAARQAYLVESLILHVGDQAAPSADQMVMLADGGIKPHRRARVGELAHDAQLHQGLEHSVHRRSGDTGDAFPDVFVNLVGAGVIHTVQQGLENHSPLDGHRQASAAACPLKMLDPRRLVAQGWMVHDGNMYQTHFDVKRVGMSNLRSRWPACRTRWMVVCIGTSVEDRGAGHVPRGVEGPGSAARWYSCMESTGSTSIPKDVERWAISESGESPKAPPG